MLAGRLVCGQAGTRGRGSEPSPLGSRRLFRRESRVSCASEFSICRVYGVSIRCVWKEQRPLVWGVAVPPKNLERRTETRLQQYERELKRGTNRSVTLHRLAESAPQNSPVNASPSRSGECCNLHGEAKGESEENSEDRAPVALD